MPPGLLSYCPTTHLQLPTGLFMANFTMAEHPGRYRRSATGAFQRIYPQRMLALASWFSAFKKGVSTASANCWFKSAGSSRKIHQQTRDSGTRSLHLVHEGS